MLELQGSSPRCPFLLVAAWRASRDNPRYAIIAVFVVGSFAALQGQQYLHGRAARRDLAELTPDRIARVELDGRPLGRPDDVTAVIRCLQELNDRSRITGSPAKRLCS